MLEPVFVVPFGMVFAPVRSRSRSASAGRDRLAEREKVLEFKGVVKIGIEAALPDVIEMSRYLSSQRPDVTMRVGRMSARNTETRPSSTPEHPPDARRLLAGFFLLSAESLRSFAHGVGGWIGPGQ